MENLSEEIEFLKNISERDLQGVKKHSEETYQNYQLFKEDTDNFQETELFSEIEEMGELLIKWVGTVKKIKEKYPQDFMEISENNSSPEEITLSQDETLPEPKFDVGEKVVNNSNQKCIVQNVWYNENKGEYWYLVEGKYNKENLPESRLKSASTRKVPTAQELEDRERAKVAKRETTKLNNQQIKIAQKRAELSELQSIVRSNSDFKEKIAEEMQAHLKSVGLAGLGKQLTPELELVQLNQKITFYKNLIRGDKDDFKAIAKRVGLDFRKSKPRKKKTEETESLSGLGSQKHQSRGIWGSFVHWFNN